MSSTIRECQIIYFKPFCPPPIFGDKLHLFGFYASKYLVQLGEETGSSILQFNNVNETDHKIG
jgi:hypothetical protein